MPSTQPSDSRGREADSCFFFAIVGLFYPFELMDDDDNYYAHTGWQESFLKSYTAIEFIS